VCVQFVWVAFLEQIPDRGFVCVIISHRKSSKVSSHLLLKAVQNDANERIEFKAMLFGQVLVCGLWRFRVFLVFSCRVI
jgi:hypothetical protein